MSSKKRKSRLALKRGANSEILNGRPAPHSHQEPVLQQPPQPQPPQQSTNAERIQTCLNAQYEDAHLQRRRAVVSPQLLAVYHSWRVRAILDFGIVRVDLLHSCANHTDDDQQWHLRWCDNFYVCTTSGRHHYCNQHGLGHPCIFTHTGASSAGYSQQCEQYCVFSGASVFDGWEFNDWWQDKSARAEQTWSSDTKLPFMGAPDLVITSPATETARRAMLQGPANRRRRVYCHIAPWTGSDNRGSAAFFGAERSISSVALDELSPAWLFDLPQHSELLLAEQALTTHNPTALRADYAATFLYRRLGTHETPVAIIPADYYWDKIFDDAKVYETDSALESFIELFGISDQTIAPTATTKEHESSQTLPATVSASAMDEQQQHRYPTQILHSKPKIYTPDFVALRAAVTTDNRGDTDLGDYSVTRGGDGSSFTEATGNLIKVLQRDLTNSDLAWSHPRAVLAKALPRVCKSMNLDVPQEYETREAAYDTALHIASLALASYSWQSNNRKIAILSAKSSRTHAANEREKAVGFLVTLLEAGLEYFLFHYSGGKAVCQLECVIQRWILHAGNGVASQLLLEPIANR